MNQSDRDLTRLLLEARVHHTRIMIEPLPVGRIVMGSDGTIETMDAWTEQLLDFQSEDVRGRSFARVFPELAVYLFELMTARKFGSLGRTNIRTRSGKSLAVEVALAPAMEPFKFVCELIFTTEL
jgi:hypothetical protein